MSTTETGAEAPTITLTDRAKLAHQVSEQCRVVAHLAAALARVHTDYGTLATAAPQIFADISEQVGPRTASLMEMLGDALNDMDANSKDDGWTIPIFAEAHRLFPQEVEPATAPQAPDRELAALDRAATQGEPKSGVEGLGPSALSGALEELSARATAGPWETFDPGGTQMMQVVGQPDADAGDDGRTIYYPPPHILDVMDNGDFEATAAFIVALVNAFRSGRLISRDAPAAPAQGGVPEPHGDDAFGCEYDDSLGPEAADYTVFWDKGARWITIRADGKITAGRSPSKGTICRTTTWEALAAPPAPAPVASEWCFDMEKAPRGGTKVDLMFPAPRGRQVNCVYEDSAWTGGPIWLWRTPKWKGGELLPESEWDTNCYPNMQPYAWRLAVEPAPPTLSPETTPVPGAEDQHGAGREDRR